MYLPVYITGLIASCFCLYATLRFLKSVVSDVEDDEDTLYASEIMDGLVIITCFVGAAGLPLALLIPLFNLLR